MSNKKEKLILVRKQKGYTQQDIADILPTEVSNYSRKEKGVVKITHIEWSKIADFLSVELEEIYEDHFSISRISPEYITLLENELNDLKDENEALKSQIETIRSIIN